MNPIQVDINRIPQALRHLLPLLRPFRARLFTLSLCALATALLRTLDPLLRQRLIDNGVLGGDIRIVIGITLLILGLFALIQLSEMIQFFCYNYINKLLPFKLLHRALRHLMRLPVSFFKDSNSNKIIENIEYDVASISKISDPIFVASLVQGLCMIGGVVGLTLINWKLTVLVLSIVPVKIAINSYYTKKRIKVFDSALKLHAVFSEWIGETVQGILTVKLWRLLRLKMSELTRLRRKMIKNEYEMAGTEQKNNVASGTVDELLTGVLYILGAIFIFSGQLTLGGLFSFISYSQLVVSSISFLTRIKFYFTPILPSLKRYLDFMAGDTEAGGSLSLPEGAPRFEFKNVTLSYNERENALMQVSFEIKPNEKIAVVGANGSGKSSLINLLLQLYEPSQGEIAYCGTDIREIKLEQYRDLFSLVEQKVFLFNATVRDNINLMRRIPDDKIMNAAMTLGAADFIDSLPDGLDTVVGVDGMKLSGGQRQKLAALRAWVKPHEILVLDEASNNLDVESEQILNELLVRKNESKILLVITHRADILCEMDKILVMEKGRLVGQGTYQELINSCPAFQQCINPSGNL